MTDPAPILVTGATGNTGSHVASGLRGRGHEVRAASRQNAFDWSDPATYHPAVSGVHSVYLVAPVETSLVTRFLEVAAEAGVHRVVQLSSSAVQRGDPGLGEIHDVVADTFPEYTVLRPSWFMQNFVGDHPLAEGIRHSGQLLSATGDGRLGFIDAADIAAVAVEALVSPEPVAPEVVLTGPEALSYAQAAEIVTSVTGVAVRHVDLTEEQLVDHLARAGYPRELAGMLAALDTRIRSGEQDFVTGEVRTITGRDPRCLGDFLSRAATASGHCPPPPAALCD